MAESFPKTSRAAASPPRPPPEDTLEQKVSRIDATVVDVRVELADYAALQKRGNKVSLRVQGDVRNLEKKVEAGFRVLRRQNEQIIRLLTKGKP